MKKGHFILGICLLSLVLFAGIVYADRTGPYWPGGTKPTAEYDGTFITITWPVPNNSIEVTSYTVTCANKAVTNISEGLPPTGYSLIMLPQTTGTWAISVAAYDADGNAAVIKTRITIP